MAETYDAIIIGSGSNGIAAAIYLQRKGLRTIIFERSSVPGGSTCTEELTLPGFKHDLGSAIHPLAYASPFFKKLPLEEHGLKWIFPEIPYSHPFEDGTAYACYRDLNKTAKQLKEDEAAYIQIFQSMTKNWPNMENDLLGPLKWPKNPRRFLQFGLHGFPSAKFLVDRKFKNEKSKVFFYGAAAHSVLPLNNLASASFGVVLNLMAHRNGWPFPKGGAGKITASLISYYRSLGGKLVLNKTVDDLHGLPEAKVYLFDLTPKQILSIKNTGFSSLYRKRLNNFRYGAGIFKIDWALDRPIPFKNDLCKRSGTIHLGFSKEELEESEKSIYFKRINKKPYVILAQHSIFDKSRAPENKHTAWAYCHVPNGSSFDYTEHIEYQIEKVAPGFKNSILKRKTHNTIQMESFNPNIIGGDINGGKQDITQLFTRPVLKLDPYSSSNPRIFICSASTPPGGGVHGMCGFYAAKSSYNYIKGLGPFK